MFSIHYFLNIFYWENYVIDFVNIDKLSKSQPLMYILAGIYDIVVRSLIMTDMMSVKTRYYFFKKVEVRLKGWKPL